MISKPRVSVLVTVFDREPYLAACLESILRSTYQDFEVVVVDDCSADDSFSVAEQFARKDGRVRSYRNQKNLGDYPNRMIAAKLAEGEFIKYVDADDIIYPHGLGLMVEGMKKFPEAGFGLSLNISDPQTPYPFISSAAEVIRTHFMGQSFLGCGPTGGIIRKSAFMEVGGFSGRKFVGDIELWLKLGEVWPLVSFPPSLVWWRQHDGQQTLIEQTQPEVLNSRLRLEQSALEATSHLTVDEKVYVDKRLRQHHARRLWSLALRKRNPILAWKLRYGSGLTSGDLRRGLYRYWPASLT